MKSSHGLANIISVHPIKKSDFDHGATRAYGALMAKSEYVLFYDARMRYVMMIMLSKIF